MLAVSRSSSSARRTHGGSTGNEEARQVQVGEVLGPQTIGPPRRVEGITDEDEGGRLEALGDGHGAHPAPEGTAPQRDAIDRDREALCERRRGAAHRLDAHRRSVGTSPPLGLSGELHPIDRNAERRHGAVDGDESGVVAAGARAG